MDDNFIDKLLIQSINHMATDIWEWPPKWDDDRKLKFLKSCIEYAEKHEFYEQCAIIKDVEKTINK
jgi:hypothetical protein